MAEKREKPARRESDGNKKMQKWKTPTERQSTSKRRLKVHDQRHVPPYKKADKLELLGTMKQMGDDFVLSAEKQDELIEDINVASIIIAHLKHNQGEPPQSEIAESLKSIQSQAERLLKKHLQIDRSPEEIWQNPVFSIEINPTICEALATAARPGSPDQRLIAEIATAVGALAHLAKAATAKPKRPKHKLNERHSAEMGRLYRAYFEQRPKKTNGSAWLTFLRWTREVAELPHLSDDRMRRLPTGQPD